MEEAGPTRRVENLVEARDAVEVSAAGRVVMPGFVDSHTHLVFPLAGVARNEDAAECARVVRAATAQRLQWRTQGYLEAMARHGTTMVEAKTGSSAEYSAETKLLRVIQALRDDPLHVVATFLLRLPLPELHGVEQTAAAGEWAIQEFLPKIRHRRLARFADVRWHADPDYRRVLARYLQAASRLGFGCRLHADGPATSEAIRAALECFAVSVDHLEHATPQDAALLAGSRTIAVLLPMASFCNGGSLAPARALIDSGAAVALGSNFNPDHTPGMNMQTVVALACRDLGMTVAEAVSASTINGAHALGRADAAGSLEPGKLADLLILNTSDYRDLGNQFGTNLVHVTMRRGKVLYQEGNVAARPPDGLNLRPTCD